MHNEGRINCGNYRRTYIWSIFGLLLFRLDLSGRSNFIENEHQRTFGALYIEILDYKISKVAISS